MFAYVGFDDILTTDHISDNEIRIAGPTRSCISPVCFIRDFCTLTLNEIKSLGKISEITVCEHGAGSVL